ncbi:MAG: valine--tRNA ligase [Planctomycetota bacterium]|nr:valine--tRNA ligase [Planctomycetota bacterium]MDA0917499.1 valine--tRNA ligase [Planctomycetota bacterium]
MSTELPKQYQPSEVQSRWLDYWKENGYFDANPNPNKKPHTIMIPLPNVTGALHMGHALNGTLQDLITRWRRMQGYETLWMPGTDHAGIATQAVVERRMFEEGGLTRHDIGREALVERIWKWKDSYEKRILEQLRQLGASCDWRRTRFTLDETCSKAVRRTFFRFFKDGLIFRGKRLVNWDPHLQTAVANDEVFHEEVDGHFWTFTYPVVEKVDSGESIVDSGTATTSINSQLSTINYRETGEKLAFSTTRPETMIGDSAICVHPTDERYEHLVGKHVRIPVTGRVIPIIADALLAKKELGTGCVKVTPAHDHNDYACGLRNNLEQINILNPDATINEHGGEKYQGMDRYDCRTKIVEDMEALGHFVEVEDRKIELAHSDRSKSPVEPYLSDQWFVKMDDWADGKPGLAQSAMDAVDDRRVRFFPQRYQRTYLDWLGEKRDWCISRQLWWGHRIPVWTLETDSESHDAIKPEWADFVDTKLSSEEGRLLVCVDAGHEDVEEALAAAGFVQEEDVLDTWFSSALWPHATLGWPDAENNPPLAGDSFNRKPQACASDGEPSGNAVASGFGLNEASGKNEVLDYFYPGNVLITSRDIITLWVARMVLTGLYNMGDIPFGHVHVHPKILDGFGQTMSKSKGNGCDPQDLIDRYGTDAVRFTIASVAGETQDVKLPMGYECPHCQNVVPQALDGKGPMVKPATVKGTLRGTSEKVLMPCPKCKKESQFSTPQYDLDPSQPAARMVSERFEYGRNFCNKLWNAARFAIMNLEGYTPGKIEESDLRLEDRWVLSRLSRVTEEVTTLLGRYQFDKATQAIRDFTWNEFCDWYLEMIKPRLKAEDESSEQGTANSERAVAQRVLVGVLDGLIRLLQPFTPFICEELWQKLKDIAPERGLFEPQATAESAMIAVWPELPASLQDANLEDRFSRLQETVVAVRNIRAVYGIGPNVPVKLFMKCEPGVAEELQVCADQFENLAKTILEAAGAEIDRPAASASFNLKDADGFVPLEGLVDVAAELERQKKEADKLRGFIKGHSAKLANEKFVSNAPEKVVAEVRETLAGLEKQLESVEAVIAQLGDS